MSLQQAFNPRLTGGGAFDAPLPNIRDSSKTNSAIDVKLGRPSYTTIKHRPWFFFFNPSEFFFLDMVDFVTSLHATFGRKLAKFRGAVEDAVFNENANEKHQKTKMRSSTRWLSRFFKILGFWPLKFQKIIFFGKMIPKIQNIQNFQKTGTYVIHLLVVYQRTKFQVNSSIFDPKWSVFVSEIIPIYDVIFSNAIFVTSGGRTQKQMTPLDSWAKTGQDRYLFCPHL